MFTSDLPWTRLGPTDRPCLHSYYDIWPEDPDSGRVLASVFESDAVPGPARIALLDASGAIERLIGEADEAIGHVGRFAIWLDAGRIAYHQGPRDRMGLGTGCWLIHHLDDGREERRPDNLRQWHRELRRGLVQTLGGRSNPHRLLQGLRIVDDDGAPLVERDVADCAAVCPPEAGVPADLDTLNIQNLKWSPDGAAFLAVFTNEGWRRAHPDAELPVFKSLVAFAADGSGGRWLGGFGHHPAWSPDGRSVIAMRYRGEVQDLLAYDPAGGERTRLLGSGLPGIHGHLLIDGSLVIDVAEGAPPRHCSIVRIVLPSGARRDLARFPHERWHHGDGHHPHPVPSPDGHRLYVNAEADGRCGLYRLELPRG